LEIKGSTCAEGDTFKAEGNKIRTKHGKFILINTNFGIINSHWGGHSGAAHIAKQAGMLDTEEQREAFQSGASWERENMLAVYEFIKSAPKDRKIILRPHPGENAAHWRVIPGIEVVTATNPLPWLHGAEILIHTGCTTGLEAAIMGKAAINLEPAPSPVGRNTNKINPTVRTAAEAIELLDSVDMSEYTKLARSMFPQGATGKIASALRDMAPDTEIDFTKVKVQARTRTAIQREKFSLSTEQAWKTLGKCSILADSLFVKYPEAA
jgi:hypothetical protein